MGQALSSIVNNNNVSNDDHAESLMSNGSNNINNNNNNIVLGERWVKHYSSSHNILLVGEGDFSFSHCLAKGFRTAGNMVATSLNSTEFLSRNYKNAMLNISELKLRGCTVMHGVDATDMADRYILWHNRFDRIVFNYPHAGFTTGESRSSQIRRHQALIEGFFDNAKLLLSEGGEIHITHKSAGFFLDWNVVSLGQLSGLFLIEEVPFQLGDYPGYSNKYGFGGDKPFDCNPSKTYKFGIRKHLAY